MEEQQMYIEMMQRSLKNKIYALDQLIGLSKIQQQMMKDGMEDADEFDKIIEQKNLMLDEIDKADNGFEQMYSKVGEALKHNKEAYREQIEDMQKMIQELTEKGVSLQALEKNNKELLGQMMLSERRKIGDFHQSNRIAGLYHNSMTRQQSGQSYFLNKS
nr:hypothetical protein [Lachnospiraceae bacterium]